MSDMLRKYWKIERKFGYKESLELSDYPKHLIKYLTENIPFVIEKEEHIYIIWHEEIVPIFQPPTHWVWTFDINKLDMSDGEYINCGTINSRKEKLNKINSSINE